MSAPELTFEIGDLVVTVGSGGFPARVGHRHRPDLDFLRARAEPGRLMIARSPQRWEFAGLVTDVDETEARYAVAGRPEIEYTIRNTFAGNWLQRHMVLNTSSAAITIEDLVLDLQPAAGYVGWAWAAPTETSWAVQPADGTGPVLSGELTQGTVSNRDTDGFHTGPMVLPPGRRLVLQWRIMVVDQAPAVVARRTLSPTTELPPNEPYEIDDPDVAVLVEDPLSLSTDGNSQVVISARPGRYPIELRSARGTSRLEVSWVPSTDDLLTDIGGGWLQGDRSAAGVALLPGAGAALGLQQAFIGRLGDVGDEAEDALSLHTTRLLAQRRLSIMEQAFLAQETVRTGDREPLQRAITALLEMAAPQPGLGLAATRVCIAELTAGGDPSPVLQRLHELAGTAGPTPPGAGDDHLRSAAVRLEMITITGPPGGGKPADSLPAALAVGAELGAGLPGHRLGRIEPSSAVYAAAVLDLLPDALGPELEQRWGTTPHELAQRTRNTAVADALWPPPSIDRPVSGTATEDELSEVVGWLVLGRPIE
ncbi:hypothetical protein [Microlunatus soli]|uniref:Uncharacterized protein n=1 Tax=Microlunatus soli TaxID=630515 RepID=A0A1H1Y4I4_9ACTN|nr:hypothetical protein [Microlunatus soli]SDT16360.1 hypothetical protein SAMN04489812_4390 [Microlunatus soli]